MRDDQKARIERAEPLHTGSPHQGYALAAACLLALALLALVVFGQVPRSPGPVSPLTSGLSTATAPTNVPLGSTPSRAAGTAPLSLPPAWAPEPTAVVTATGAIQDSPDPFPTATLSFTWSVSDSKRVRFYYMPGTAAERDRFQLGALAEAALDRLASWLEVRFDGQISVYLVPRVFWQGGAAYGGKILLISYLDRNYAGVETWTYFTHEGAHALAQDWIQPKDQGGPDGVLLEGLAMWASDGHYRQEPLDEWAAVLAASEHYIPLADLRRGPFYDFQHEIAYLEAGSFVKYLIDHYGLDRFKSLYGQTTGDTDHDEGLVQSLYGQSYADLEAAWLSYLTSLHPSAEEAETWWLTVRSFDLMRRYETELDPDARILPPKAPPEWTGDMLQIFIDNAHASLNIVLETALIAIQDRIGRGDLEGAARLMDDIEAALDSGGTLERPSLQARLAILNLLQAQDQAILRADREAYLRTLEEAYAQTQRMEWEEIVRLPFTLYRQEPVRLEVTDDGRRAQGVVLVSACRADSKTADHGRLVAVSLIRTAEGWRMSWREAVEPILMLPPEPSPAESRRFLAWPGAPGPLTNRFQGYSRLSDEQSADLSVLGSKPIFVNLVAPQEIKLFAPESDGVLNAASYNDNPRAER